MLPSMVNPSIRFLYCSMVMFFMSSSFLGHWKRFCPLSLFVIKR